MKDKIIKALAAWYVLGEEAFATEIAKFNLVELFELWLAADEDQATFVDNAAIALKGKDWVVAVWDELK